MGAVGKSAITIRLVANEFWREYDSTIEEYYSTNIMIDGKFEKLDIKDTAGQRLGNKS